MASKRALERARGLLGTRFRLQGRDPGTGVDCIGLAILAFRLDPDAIPDDYRLSSPGRDSEFKAMVERIFRRVGRGRPGNLALMDVGKRRLHLGVVSETGIIHADAQRGRVIDGPVPHGGRIVGVFRKRRQACDQGKS